MIPFDFIYVRPNSLKEAALAYQELETKGKSPVYYAGGSEIITMSRIGSIEPGAVIDIKYIQECKVLSLDKQKLHIGAICTLNEISQSQLFPLLSLSCGRIADHTNQCRITIGGNLCGSIIYRETSLPLLISDAEIIIFSQSGERTVPFQSVFDGRMRLSPGEMIVELTVPLWALSARHAHIKKTANEKIDYPLLSLAAIQHENKIRAAFSGICPHPFRSKEIEYLLNDNKISFSQRAEAAADLLPDTVYSDAQSSREYRLFVLKNTLLELLEGFQNGTV